MRTLIQSTSLTALLATSLAGGGPNLLAQESPALSWRTVEIGLLGSTHNLEGPAVNGYGDEEGDDESGIGIFVRARTRLGQWFHITGDVSAEQVDSDVQVIRGYVTPGVHWSPVAEWALYAEVGLAFASFGGLDDYSGRTAAAVGNGGTDLGLLAMVGVRNQLTQSLEWHFAAGYMAFGSEDYPTGAAQDNSSGDGPYFELGAAYDLSQEWSLAASWTGTWVEDAGTEVDIASQQVRIGARYAY